MKLPLNCTVEYISDFLAPKEADDLYRCLLEEYKLDQSRIVMEAGGKMITTDSFKILFATERLINENTHPESVHGKIYEWSGVMANLREKVESLVGKTFEIAMCIYYPDGNYYAPYHFDQQTSGYETILPSLSLGASREFCFRENNREETYSLALANGSLLVMGAYCQSRYMHSLPKSPTCKNGRINITFREPNFQ